MHALIVKQKRPRVGRFFVDETDANSKCLWSAPDPRAIDREDFFVYNSINDTKIQYTFDTRR